MNARLRCVGFIVALLPLAIEVPARRDSGAVGETRITLIGGVGRYAIIDRGCEGNVIAKHPHEFEDVGGEIEHRFPNGLTLGARGGTVRDVNTEHVRATDYTVYPARESLVTVKTVRRNTYVIPSLAYEGMNLGLGIGLVGATERFTVESGEQVRIDPSFHFRAGPRDLVYFEISYMEALPLYSGGGLASIGFGVHPNRLWDVHGGFVGGGPYDGFGLALGFERRIREHYAVSLRSRLGESAGTTQSGMALGVSYVSRPPLPRSPFRQRTPSMGSAWGLAARRETKPASTPRPPREPPLPRFGEYQSVDSLPRVLTRAAPVRPDTASDSAAAVVTLAALVDAQGRIQDIRVIRSVPSLDEAAVACVRQWGFRPAQRAGRPVAYWLMIPVEFPPRP